MNKILILYEPLASWSLSVCKHGNLRCVCCAALYSSSALSVVLCPSSAEMRQLFWKNSNSWPWVYWNFFFSQKKDPTSIHKCQFFMSDLRKKKWFQSRAVCCLFLAVYWQYKLPIDGWDPSVSRWSSTGVGEDVPHPSLQHCALGTTVRQTSQSLLVSHHLSQPW